MSESYDVIWPWMHLAGRVLFSIVFIVYGLQHFTQRQTMVGYATSRHVPAPGLAVPVGGLMILTGGIFVLLGWHRFIGAGLITLFLLGTCGFMHRFWGETDPTTRQMHRVHFFKDLALAGAALFIAAYSGPYWPMSLGG